jgi:hypothetical protein
LLKSAKAITTVKGKDIRTWDLKINDKKIILKYTMTPSGMLRVPALRMKDRFIIGFNRELYDEWLARNDE